MGLPKFSANLGFLWTDRPLLDRVAAAANAGFQAIEAHWPYDIPPDQFRRTCEAEGVQLLALNTAVGNAADGDFGLGAVAGRQADFERVFDQAARYARAAGASKVHIMAGVVPSGDKHGARQIFAANLRTAAGMAPDLTLLLEPINQRDKPGYFYSTLAEAVALIDLVGEPNLKLMFDVYHVGVSEGDILTRLQRYMPVIGHVQIAAVPSRAEPDEGEIAYRAIFAALDRLGYDGWIGCEYKPRAGTDEGLRWTQALGVSL